MTTPPRSKWPVKAKPAAPDLGDFWAMHPDLDSLKEAARLRYPDATDNQVAILAATMESKRPKEPVKLELVKS